MIKVSAHVTFRSVQIPTVVSFIVFAEYILHFILTNVTVSYFIIMQVQSFSPS